MITGAIKSQVDSVWNAFWSGGISNPLEVIEQITYLLFIRRRDAIQTLRLNQKVRTKKPVNLIFPEGTDRKGRSYEHYRWSQLRNLPPAEMFIVVGEHVFPFLRELGGDESTYAQHMKDARFTIPTPALLAKVVDLIADIPLEGRDTPGISTSTCSARSPQPDRTASSARPATSSA